MAVKLTDITREFTLENLRANTLESFNIMVSAHKQMEFYEIEKQEHGLHVHGFPDAVKLLKLSDAKAKRLGVLALHKHDLDFALQCLDGINLLAEEPYALPLGLWR